MADRRDTVADTLILNRVDGRLDAVDQVFRRNSPVTVDEDDLDGSAAVPDRNDLDLSDALKKFDLCLIVGLVSAVCLGFKAFQVTGIQGRRQILRLRR